MATLILIPRPRSCAWIGCALTLGATFVPVVLVDAARAGVRVDTIGYATAAEKQATVEATEATLPQFRVLRTRDRQSVFEGELRAISAPDETESVLYIADFSALMEPGMYCVDVPDVGTSPPFAIHPNPYDAAFRLAVQALRLWRCGTAVSVRHGGDVFEHDACHLDDGYELEGGPQAMHDGTGGWHDAGDYNKYVVNAGVSIGCLLRAWEDFHPAIEACLDNDGDTPESLPTFLDEIRWEIDWLLKMQRDDGSVCHKLSTLRFGEFMMPEEEIERRYFSDWGTAATASFVAMTAASARAFAPYDPRYAETLRKAARRGHAFLVAHPEQRRPDLSPFRTGRYQSSDRDDRLWALAEIWETEGDADALRRLEHEIETLLVTRDSLGVRRLESGGRRRRRGLRGGFDTNWDWGNVKNLALLTYISSSRPERKKTLVASLTEDLLRAANQIVQAATTHPYGRPLGERYYWGSNGGVARQTLVLEAAYRTRPDVRYRAAQAGALHYLFGRNPFGRSYVTGIGHNPPLHPHDRRSGGDEVEAPWPGYLVGGPERGPLDWRDEQDDYRTNEIAVNWNAALIYALASQLPRSTHTAGP